MTPTVEQLAAFASSPAAKYRWKGRGLAPIGYVKGMALAYANIYADMKAGNEFAVFMARANTHDANIDALSWYAGIFSDGHMDNSKDGADTLRHMWVLLWGLGMRESSGLYCCGRDRSASNTTADTAETGLFQQSWNSHIASSLMLKMFVEWRDSGMRATFAEGVSCSAADWENYGSGSGFEFQRRCKMDPFFAVQFAAVGLRCVRRHWGPIDTREAEVRPEVDTLLKQVQSIVDTDT
jgi:hypothetical protein